MINDLLSLLNRFAGLKVLVIGEAMLDSYLDGTVGRLCREAPALVVKIIGRRNMPGAAANTAVNVHALGGEASFLSVVGEDAEAAHLRQCLLERGVSPEHLLSRPHPRTVAKNRVIAGSQMLLRLDQGGPEPLDEETEGRLIDRLLDLYPRSDAVIVSDYCYGILSPRVIAAVEKLQQDSPRPLLVDSKNLGAYRQVRPTAVKPNYEEAVRLLGLPPLDEPGGHAEQVQGHEKAILDSTGARIAAVTLDAEGAIVFERGKEPYRTIAYPTRQFFCAGAGDTFAATFTLALAAGATSRSAADLASAAAAIVVGKNGTSTCSAQEIRDSLSLGEEKAMDLPRLALRAQSYRRQDRRIVFTNGCFDLIHSGHIAYLQHARALGDVLIVGVNSDSSVRRLKGPSRPVNSLEERLKVLSALRCIDHLVSFDQDTPHDLIRTIRPSVFVKGGDYRRETIPEASLVEELGGVVQILPYQEQHSTTKIIERIQNGHRPVSPEPSAAAREVAGLLSEPGGPGLATPPRSAAGGASSYARAPVSSREWSRARRVLCVRLDNMGDLLMTTPALRAFKEAKPGREIVLLTSPRNAELASLIPEVDEVLTYEAPWVKASADRNGSRGELEMAGELRRLGCDAAAIFTVYSQNPLPAAYLCHLADIPLRLAHCRENPYQLLTHWVPDSEPEEGVRHEVRRQLDLAAAVGCRASQERMSVRVPTPARERMRSLLAGLGLAPRGSWAAVHPGASAPSRRYPAGNFVEVCRGLFQEQGLEVVFTGSPEERELVEEIRSAAGVPSHSLVGISLAELAAFYSLAPVLIANNTGPAHLAAAVGTPVVSLYALTNPQHAPWGVPCRVLSHDVSCKYCYRSVCPETHHDCLRLLEPAAVAAATRDLLLESGQKRGRRRGSLHRTMALGEP